MATAQSRRTFLGQAAGLAAATTLPVSAFGQPVDPAIAEITGELATGQLGRVVPPGTAGHDKITAYNARFDCVRSTTFLQPASREGVQAIAAWAKRHNRRLAIRGVGHSFEGKSSHPDIVVDMSRMTAIGFDGERRLEVEAGVLLGAVYDLLGAKGFVIPAGTCPTVGIVGHTLGGGIGDFLPMFGFAAQALREVTLVTLQGTALRVTETTLDKIGGEGLDTAAIEPAALMRALRGGGQGMFGIVTNMVFEAADLRRAQLASFKLEGAGSVSRPRAAAMLEAWQGWRMRLPPAMQDRVSSKVNFGRSGNTYSLEVAGLVVVPEGATGGGVEEIRASLGPLLGMRDWSKREFKRVANVPAAIATFRDDDETSYNWARKQIIASSSMLNGPLPKAALDYFLANVPAGVDVSFYTSGGRTKTGPATSLHPSEFLLEWVAERTRYEPNLYRRFKAINLEMMRRANAGDGAFPNYCDHEARNYFPNRSEIDGLRALLDPGRLSTSSLLDQQPGPACA